MRAATSNSPYYGCSNFAWNFLDVYLIIISVLLTQKFSCINRRLQNNHRVRSSQFWNETWCAYKVSVDLVERTNELNGFTILISFFSNLYFICVQMLGCFKSETSLLDGLYLWFSLIFLIGRTLGKSLAGTLSTAVLSKLISFQSCLLVRVANQRRIEEAFTSVAVHSLGLFRRHDEAFHRAACDRKSRIEWNEFFLFDQKADSERESLSLSV